MTGKLLMSNLLKHAEHELELAGLFDGDSDYGGMLGTSVMKLIAVFASEGHSGMSAQMAISLFEKLARFEPLTPLTGEDHEWDKVDYGCEPTYQNKRFSRVFKNSYGRTYDVNARIFRRPDGSCYTSGDSSKDITFPYMPSKEYVDVRPEPSQERCPVCNHRGPYP